MFLRAILTTMVAALAAASAWADTGASEADLNKVSKSLKGVPIDIPALFSQTPDGYYRFIGAPRGTSFQSSTGAKSGDPEAAARAYLAEHGAAFGAKSAQIGFAKERVRTRGETTYLRFDQTYGGVEVFGAQVNVQVDKDGGIQSVMSDIMRDTGSLAKSGFSVQPTLTADQARQRALALAASLYPGKTLAVEGAPELRVYHPSVIGNYGATRLVWIVTVASPGTHDVRESIFVNAHSGEVVFHYNLIEEGLFRRVYDNYRVYTYPGILRRQEGQGVTLIDEVDNAYDFLGDTYNYFFDNHGRDSMDNGGIELDAIVRIEGYGNASWNGSTMEFGLGYVTDDITAHELTHGVTQWSSNLVYWRESGAINESLSDIWGEFVDLTNQRGENPSDDPDAVRWIIGEELPASVVGPDTAERPAGLRSMKNPPLFDEFLTDTTVIRNPDRYGDWFETGFFDNGGVHLNSGICNKLAYLLTDGSGAEGNEDGGTAGQFNGHAVTPLGIEKVSNLFYEAQVNLLTEASDYRDLALLLTYSAYNLDWTEAEIRNVEHALKAVEILQEDAVHPVRWLRATSLQGEAIVRLTWENEVPSDKKSVTIVRRTDRFPTSASDVTEGIGVIVQENVTADRFDDNTVTLGQQYFYGVFTMEDQATEEEPALDKAPFVMTSSDFARVVAGEGQQNYLTQVFSKNGPTPVDLSFTQFTYDPVTDRTAAYASGQVEAYNNFNNYKLTVAKNIFELPVSRDGAYYVNFTEDGWLYFEPDAPIPFFGKPMIVAAVSANGYIANYNDLLDAYDWSSTGYYNFPSTHSHFEFPKLSFLFTDLSQDSGGVVWSKGLSDRLVLTFEKVPEFGSRQGNTVQVELYYSGRIRVTYLEVNAKNLVVGLSDGNGVPFDPTTGLVKQSDLSEQAAPSLITIDPIAPIFVDENEEARFSVLAHTPNGAAANMTVGRVGSTGLLEDLPAGAAFTPGTGTATNSAEFVWVPEWNQAGVYTFRMTFALGSDVATQEVQVSVGDNIRIPRLLPDQAGVDTPPAITPAFPMDSEPLRLDYTYVQEDGLDEGLTTIYWFKNGVYMDGFTNRRIIPAQSTEVDEEWYAIVIPKASTGLEGEPHMSNIVKIGPNVESDVNKDGATNALDLQAVINAVLDITPKMANHDVDGDQNVNAVDVQLLINSILRP